MIRPLRLQRVAINKGPMVHGMVQAANLVLEKEYRLAMFGIDNFLEAKLMIAHVLGD